MLDTIFGMTRKHSSEANVFEHLPIPAAGVVLRLCGTFKKWDMAESGSLWGRWS